MPNVSRLDDGLQTPPPVIQLAQPVECNTVAGTPKLIRSLVVQAFPYSFCASAMPRDCVSMNNND